MKKFKLANKQKDEDKELYKLMSEHNFETLYHYKKLKDNSTSKDKSNSNK